MPMVVTFFSGQEYQSSFDQPRPCCVQTVSQNQKLQIGLILCDDVDPDARETYGTYTEMFQTGLDPDKDRIELTAIRAYEGESLPAPGAYDGYVISGSRYSVYEDKQWIKNLLAFVRACWEQQVVVVGICFGHQLIAHALGGRTEKADVGWGFGIHTARITQKQPWMTTTDSLNGDLYNLIVIHQDQVVKMPGGFRTIAENDFCPNSMIVADGKMLGIQGHPEFSKEFCRFRADFRRELIGEDVYQSTLETLEDYETHSATILSWVDNFLEQANHKR